MPKNRSSEYMAVNTAARLLGVRAKGLRALIGEGRIKVRDGKIPLFTVEEIRRQKEAYVSLREYLVNYDGDRFDSSIVRNRAKYIDFLEENDYFGVTVIPPEMVLLTVPYKNEFFIPRDDIAFLDYKSKPFFESFGMTEQEKADKILSSAKSNAHTRKYIQSYLEAINDEAVYTPSLTEFMRIVCEISEITHASDDDVIGAIESADMRKTKELLVRFFRFVSSHTDVKYHDVELKKQMKFPLPRIPTKIMSGLRGFFLTNLTTRPPD